jgi:hypothetical protein
MAVAFSAMILLDLSALPDIEGSPAWEFINQMPVQKNNGNFISQLIAKPPSKNY